METFPQVNECAFLLPLHFSFFPKLAWQAQVPFEVWMAVYLSEYMEQPSFHHPAASGTIGLDLSPAGGTEPWLISPCNNASGGDITLVCLR